MAVEASSGVEEHHELEKREISWRCWNKRDRSLNISKKMRPFGAFRERRWVSVVIDCRLSLIRVIEDVSEVE